MNTQKFTIGVISLVVAVILVTGVLIPVIADNSGEGVTITNEGAYKYTPFDNQEHTYTISLDGNNVVVSEDDTVKMTIDSTTIDNGESVPIFIGNNSFIAVDGNITDPYGDGLITSWYDYMPFYFDGPDSYSDIELTLGNNGTFDGYDDYMISYLPDTNGGYVLTTTPNVGLNTTFCGLCMDDDYPFIITSSLSALSLDSISQCHLYDEYEYSDITPTYEQNDQIYTIQNITITGDSDGTAFESTTSYFIVQSEMEFGAGIDPTLTTLLSVIPLIVVVGLIVGTVGYFMRRQ